MASRRGKSGQERDTAGAFAEALAHQRAGAWDAAAALYRRILARDRGNPQAESQLALAEFRLGDAAGAARRAGRLLKRFPDEAGLHNLSGEALRALGRPEEAVAAFRRAIALQPGHAAAHNNLGAALVSAGRTADAIPLFERAAALAPDRAEARLNLMEALIKRGEYGRAGEAMTALHALVPDDSRVLLNQHDLMTRTCDWAALPDVAAALDAALVDALSAGRCPAEPPFTNMARKIDAAETLAVARAWSAAIAESAATAAATNRSQSIRRRRRRRGDGRLRLGYLSADFRDHPVAHLLGGMFARHDRAGFHVTAYSHGPADGSPERRRLETDCDAVADLAALGDGDAAARIAADGIDILIDLMGHTGGNRLGILARRPAPVQVTYLGFPGTSGADFIDYILTDRVVTPPVGPAWCTEQPVYLPHSFQVNGREPLDPAAQKTGGRAAHGLPETGVVFCSFNQHFKIEPVMAEAWMAILRDVPGSVLWLGGDNPLAEANLRRFAEGQGVDGTRLRFTPKQPQQAHLARLAHADIGLDTRIYNGHTTTSDLLWMGVPVITLLGASFASRVAASLLTAHGMADLIAGDLRGYCDLAVGLARDPARLRAMTQRVADNRMRCPLFDCDGFVRGLERAYREIWAIHAAGAAPRPVDLTAAAPGRA